MVVRNGKPKANRVTDLKGTSTMERMKKILGSPMMRKKNIAPPPPSTQGTPTSSSPASSSSSSSNHVAASLYIGTPLAEIVRRENREVPVLVTKVCSYIYKYGLDCEGIFRVNGNSRVVERLRATFDREGGAAELSDAVVSGDVMAVAGLLKMFLRELPDALIPERVTRNCVHVQEEHVKDTPTCLTKLRSLLVKLPTANWSTLKYLVRFLVLVTQREADNKMTPMALGIVFGPNLFRCSGGIQGLREQGVTNHITLNLIKYYDQVFLEDSETSPSTPGATLTSLEATSTTPKPSRVAPPRPPPPQGEGPPSGSPVATLRKHKNKRNATLFRDPSMTSDLDLDLDLESDSKHTDTGSRSDEEYLDTNRSGSPFVLDSDRSEYGSLISPRTQPPAGSNHVVEKVISSAITQHLFGDSSSNQSSDDSLTPHNTPSSPVPAPRRKKHSAPKAPDNNTEKDHPESLERRISVKDRVSQLQTEDDLRRPATSSTGGDDGRPRKHRPKSRAFEMFEEQGIMIGLAPADLTSTLKARQPPSTTTTNHTHHHSSSDSDSSVGSNSGVQGPQSGVSQDAESSPVPKPRRSASTRSKQPITADVVEPRKLPTRPLADTEPTSDWQELPTPAPDNKLAGFKRAPGPKNRRTPSRPKRNSMELDSTITPNHHDNVTDDDVTMATNNAAFVTGDEEPEKKVPKQQTPPEKPRPFLQEIKTEDDLNHNETRKPSIRFLSRHPSYESGSSSGSGSGSGGRDHGGSGSGSSDADHSPTVSRKPCVPPLDLSILHEHGDGSEPISAEQGHSLSLQKAAKQYKDDDAAVLSPRMMKLKHKKNYHSHSHQHRSQHWSSCYRTYYNTKHYSSAHPDTDVPPSPPTDQTHILGRKQDDANAVAIKQLTKKIQSYKKKIKLFEEAFEQEHGYRPSKSDKVAQVDIKRSMQELEKARKELRKVKEDIEAERRAAASSPSGLAVLPNGRTLYGDPGGGGGGIHTAGATDDSRPPTMEETLHLLQDKLQEKRADNHRPEDLEEMTREETQEEKLAVQKALLHFENIHGRPTTKTEKELMRPLYDRYRNIKKILTKPPSPRDKLSELQAVPEDQTIEFTPSPSTAHSTNRDPIRVPTADREDDFMVTKDFRLLMKDTVRPGGGGALAGASIASPGAHLDLSPDTETSEPRNLHELTVPQLLEEQQRGRNDKKRLRKVLREFEEDFTKQTGRKVLKEDRSPMESEYQQYKQVKARLKLLDALLSKHDPLSAY